MKRTIVVSVLFLLSATSGRSFGLEDGQLVGPIGTSRTRESTSDPAVIFVNGLNTEGDSALRTAGALGAHLHSPVYLLYSDLTLPVVDWFSVAIEKVGDADTSVNAATDAL